MAEKSPLNGHDNTNLIEDIEHDNLALFCNNAEFVSRLSNGDLLDAIINDNNRDITLIALELCSHLPELWQKLSKHQTNDHLNTALKIDQLSGCELTNLIENIGYDNLALFTNKDDLISRLSDETLLDAIVNDNDRNIEQLIIKLYSSLLGFPETKANKQKLNALKKLVNDHSV